MAAKWSCLFGFFFLFHHSIFITHHSSPITHHLKYPNSLHSTCLDIVFIFHHSNISTFLWDPYLSWVSDPFIFSKPTFIPLYARTGVFNSPPHVASLSLTFQFDSLSILHYARLWWKSAWTHNATCHYHMYKPLVSQRSLTTLLATIICTFHRLFFFFLSFWLCTTVLLLSSLIKLLLSSQPLLQQPTLAEIEALFEKNPEKTELKPKKNPNPNRQATHRFKTEIQTVLQHRTHIDSSNPPFQPCFLFFFFFFFMGLRWERGKKKKKEWTEMRKAKRKGKKKKERTNWDEKG